MKFRAALPFAVAITTVLTCVSSAIGDDRLDEQLKSHYQNKVLMLRHFYRGDHLSFDVDGSLMGTEEVGPWTVFGQIFVKSVDLKTNTLRIEGRRVCLVFDDKSKSFRDVLDYLEETSKPPDENKGKKHGHDKQQAPDWAKIKDHYRNQAVEIDIELGGEIPDVQQIFSALTAVFLQPTESVASIVPEFWRDYFDRVEGRPPRSPQSREPVYRVRPPGVSPPRVIYQPTPEFSDEARMAKLQGVETFSVVVDTSGGTTDIQISSPLGLGLDEKGIEAIRKWKFEPARKDGKPVQVKIAIEADFHLN